MAAYLIDNPPVRSQFRAPRRARPTGCIVVHTAESAMDSIGPDTGAENVARWMTTRTTPGSYHDLADSDSYVHLVDYGDEAYQDGTGSNPWAMSISFALAAADWPRLSVTKRAAFLQQGARAFAAQQAWLKANGHPLTPLVRITRAQSENRVPGFISHAERDPARRTDPGRDFPWTQFFAACAHAAGPIFEEDDMTPDECREVVREELRGLLTMHVPDPVPGGKALRLNYLLHNTRAAAGLAAARTTDADALAEAIVDRLPDPSTVTAADLARELLTQLAATPRET